jgi:hypothetical protein
MIPARLHQYEELLNLISPVGGRWYEDYIYKLRNTQFIYGNVWRAARTWEIIARVTPNSISENYMV